MGSATLIHQVSYKHIGSTCEALWAAHQWPMYNQLLPHQQHSWGFNRPMYNKLQTHWQHSWDYWTLTNRHSIPLKSKTFIRLLGRCNIDQHKLPTHMANAALTNIQEVRRTSTTSWKLYRQCNTDQHTQHSWGYMGSETLTNICYWHIHSFLEALSAMQYWPTYKMIET